MYTCVPVEKKASIAGIQVKTLLHVQYAWRGGEEEGIGKEQQNRTPSSIGSQFPEDLGIYATSGRAKKKDLATKW